MNELTSCAFPFSRATRVFQINSLGDLRAPTWLAPGRLSFRVCLHPPRLRLWRHDDPTLPESFADSPRHLIGA